MSLQAEYDYMRTGQWADEDASRCPCRGSGYCLSDLDTWHQCPVHFNGQTHPEDYYGGDAPEPWEPPSQDHPNGLVTVGGQVVEPPAKQVVVHDDDEIPF